MKCFFFGRSYARPRWTASPVNYLVDPPPVSPRRRRKSHAVNPAGLANPRLIVIMLLCEKGQVWLTFTTTQPIPRVVGERKKKVGGEVRAAQPVNKSLFDSWEFPLFQGFGLAEIPGDADWNWQP